MDSWISSTGPGGNVAFLLNRARNLVQTPLAAEVHGLHLSPQQAIMVLTVARACDAGSELTPASLADRLGVDRPTLSAMLTKLVRTRWLATSPNPSDGRSRTVHLGSMGAERVDDVRSAANRAIERALSGIPNDELERVAAFLEEIIACMKQCAESGAEQVESV